MAFLKNRPLLNKFIQVRTCTFSMLWRRNSSFRQVMPKFPYPSAVNITRHQLVKPRPPPTTSEALAQMYPNGYTTPKLTKSKSRKFKAFLSDKDNEGEARLNESKYDKPKSSMLKSKQLRKFMSRAGTDDAGGSELLKDLKIRIQEHQGKLKQQQQEHKLQSKSKSLLHQEGQQDKARSKSMQHKEAQQDELQQQQQKSRSKSMLPQGERFYGEHFTERQPESVSKQREEARKLEASTTLLRPRPRHPRPQQPQLRQIEELEEQQMGVQVERQVSGELKNFRKKFNDHHENMQKIKERDRKLKDQVQKLKIFERMTQLMKQQQELDKKELKPYNDQSNRLKSANGQTQVFADHLRPPTQKHPVYTSRLQQPPDFAPYTPTNVHSDNGDVESKKQRPKPISRLCPVSEYHKDKAVTMEANRREQAHSRESAMYRLCKHLNTLPNSKY